MRANDVVSSFNITKTLSNEEQSRKNIIHRSVGMKIVTYNVNGLRPRIAQYGSLLKLLDALDADVICFQETKLSRQELTADLIMANGYESFFSCTRTVGPGRVGYSGVATFCRVKSAFSSTEVALPVEAEEGFTGLLENSGGFLTKNDQVKEAVDGLEEFEKVELLKVDSEGRCVITDHGHFVLFNIYGPRAESDDAERIQFKITFYKVLQRRWESLLRLGRRILIVGDLNIAPSSIDRCDAERDFENNQFRRWLRSMLVEHGGSFFDAFRAKHPDRRDAYTCWPQNTGAEEFNFGSRIDHILVSRSCLHQECCLDGHNFVACHVHDCDTMMKFQRWKPGITPRWKGGRSIKLEGSDHIPVYVRLIEVPAVPCHSTPPLSSRYAPGIRGYQQTIVSALMKRQVVVQGNNISLSASISEVNSIERSSTAVWMSSQESSVSNSPADGSSCSSNQEKEDSISRSNEFLTSLDDRADDTDGLGNRHIKAATVCSNKKRARTKAQGSQLSLKSFFKRSPKVNSDVDGSGAENSVMQGDVSTLNNYSSETCQEDANDKLHSSGKPDRPASASDHVENGGKVCTSAENEKKNTALQEWQRIHQVMQNSIPVCKGHKEPCVARVVKKAGPTCGRRFYVCSRPEGPASNPEANCGYFKWATMKSRK